ncbi:MAG: hypothetical protein U1E65_18775 [Myxococcota bacterium]
MDEDTKQRTLRALVHAARNPLAALAARLELAEDHVPLDAESISDMREAAARIDASLRVLGIVLNQQGEEPWGSFIDVWVRVLRQFWPGIQLEITPEASDLRLVDAADVGQRLLRAVERLTAGATRPQLKIGLEEASSTLLVERLNDPLAPPQRLAVELIS